LTTINLLEAVLWQLILPFVYNVSRASTTFADSFTPRFLADPSSAAPASLRWQSNDEPDDGVAHCWQAWLTWRPVDFFPASLL
jgi:hypothetical protein